MFGRGIGSIIKFAKISLIVLTLKMDNSINLINGSRHSALRYHLRGYSFSLEQNFMKLRTIYPFYEHRNCSYYEHISFLPFLGVFRVRHPILETLCCYIVYWLIKDCVQSQHGREYLILKQKRKIF